MIRSLLKNRKPDNRGFTLVEVVIAIGALGVICAVLLRLFVLAGNTNDKASDMQAAQLAVSSVAEVFAGSDSVRDALETLGLEATASVTGDYALTENDLTIEVSISEQEGGYPGTLYALDILAIRDGREIVAISTAKYDKEARS